ncbi:771_t:CDS:2 [Diversispora eburnea]|uniref:771_t:CDS:1 n=1 Tax=Diversispora eburnea TaxID=1213867 RepID=A0A9N8V1R9_9GLOM|nr:771_t:CDS:2 [Diversispora eburnea]
MYSKIDIPTPINDNNVPRWANPYMMMMDEVSKLIEAPGRKCDGVDITKVSAYAWFEGLFNGGRDIFSTSDVSSNATPLNVRDTFPANSSSFNKVCDTMNCYCGKCLPEIW